MSDKLWTLVEKLAAQTRAKKLTWEDKSGLSQGEQFQVVFGDTLVEIKKDETRHWDGDGEEVWIPSIRLEVRNQRARIVALLEADERQIEYNRLEPLFDLALANARNQEVIIDSLLQKLGA